MGITTQPDSTFAGYATLETHACITCGVLFAIPEEMGNQARAKGNFKIQFYCPNGHQQGYGESQADKLKRKLDAERERSGRLASNLEQTEAQLRGQKAAATRARNQRDAAANRSAAGVCPVPGCKRSFKQLGRHMKSQHPDYPHEHAHDGG